MSIIFLVKLGDEGKILIVCLYVHDLIFTGNDEHMFEELKSSMMQEFEMSDLGQMRCFLSIEVLQSQEGIFICQKKYVQEVCGSNFMCLSSHLDKENFNEF